MSTIVTGLMPEPKIQFFDNTGKPLAGGLLYTYHPGQPGVFKATYKSATAGDDYNTNPIVLDAGGRASVWLDGYYDMELRSSTGTTIWTQSNVSSFPYDSLAYITSIVKDNETNINTVATNITDVNIVADNISDVTNFADVYYGPSATDPTTRKNGDPLENGDLYFNTVDNGLKAYANGVWYTTDTLGATDAQLVTYTAAGTGAVEATVQTELRKTFRTSNYSTFAQAVTASTGYTLIVDSDVSIAADTTVTVSITHELPGKFTIASGQTLTINGPFQCGLFQCFDGDGSVVFGSGSVTEVYPEWFSSTGGVVEAIVASQGYAKISLQKRAYVETKGIVNNVRGIIVEGVFGDRATIKGSEIQFSGAGAFFDNGTDNGLPWDGVYYDGPQSIEFRNIDIRHVAADTSLTASPGSSYKAGSYAIRDWRGGDIKLKNVVIENFDYGFWGIQSDLNDFDNVQIRTCNIGIYAGPRSDQFTINKLYATLSNQAIVIDRAQVRIDNPQIVGCGTSTLYPVEIRKGTTHTKIMNPWFEHYQGYAGTDQVGFIGAGLVDGYGGITTSCVGVSIFEPLIATSAVGASYHTKFLIGLGAAIGTKLYNPFMAVGLSLANLNGLVESPTGTSALTNNTSNIIIYGVDYNTTSSSVYTNTSSCTAAIDIEQGNGQLQYYSSTGRLAIGKIGAAAGADLIRLSTEGSIGFFYLNYPNYATYQKNRLFLWKSHQDASAMPTSGSWEKGDIVTNIVPAESGTAGSKYIVHGWIRMTTGSAHVLNTDWFEMRTLTGN